MPQALVPVIQAIGGAIISAGAYEAGIFIIGAAASIASSAPIGRPVATAPATVRRGPRGSA